MTRAAPVDYGGKTQTEAYRSMPLCAANFIRSKFPSYKIRSNGVVLEPSNGPDKAVLKEIVAKETADLLDRRQRLSVRELTMKFEKGLNTANLLSKEVKWKQVALLERDILLKNLRNVLGSLSCRVVGKNKDEIDKSMSMVETLTVQLSKRETELLQQKAEVTRIANSLKLASEDAKRIVEEERANARTEIENARATVQRVQLALQEHEIFSQRTKKQDIEELKKEVQQARRIKMLHHSSKVMDMVNEIQILRNQLSEKSSSSVHLLKEFEAYKRLKENKAISYELDGLECLGSMLHIIPAKNSSADLSNCSIQWFRMQPKGNTMEVISGATRPVYAPEPYDVGRFLQAEITSCGESARLVTAGPVDPAPGLGDYIEALVRKPEMEFTVVVVQVNGDDQPSNSIHVLNIGKLRMRLNKGKTVIAKEFYSSAMQLCGVRGGGDAASQTIFWQPRTGLHFALAFESARERNAAIMLARRFAIDCNIILAGPGDKTPW